MYKDIILPCMKEKFGRLYFIYYIVVGILSLLVGELAAIGILTVITIFTAMQISRMLCFTEINCINNGYYSFRVKRPRNIVITALLANIPWLFFLIVKIMSVRPDMIFFSFLVWVYLTVVGIISGSYIENEVLCYGLMLLIFFFCMQKTLIHELYFRYITPVLLLRGEVNSFNVWGLCILSVFGTAIILSVRKKTKIVLFFVLMISLCGELLCEVNYESRISKSKNTFIEQGEYSLSFNPVLPKEDMIHIAGLFNETEKLMNDYGFDFKTRQYDMRYSVYFPWESSREKVFIMNNNDECQINFYADSLCNISDKELIARYVYSSVDIDTELQEIAVNFLAEEVAARIIDNENSSQITGFLYDNLVETYGRCVSPKQCVIAECLRKTPEDFYALYSAFGKVTALEEINIEELETRDAYKAIFRRVLE